MDRSDNFLDENLKKKYSYHLRKSGYRHEERRLVWLSRVRRINGLYENGRLRRKPDWWVYIVKHRRNDGMTYEA